MASPAEEKEYGFSDDDKLMEDAVGELLAAWDAKDHASLITALKAIIHSLKAKGEAHAHDSL